MKEKLNLVLTCLLIPIFAQAHGFYISTGETIFLLSLFLMPFVYLAYVLFCFKLAKQAETTGITTTTKVIASILMVINTLALLFILFLCVSNIFDHSSFMDCMRAILDSLIGIAISVFAWGIPFRAYMKGIKAKNTNS